MFSIQDVVSCPQLPSLPAIASQVLELTSSPDVPIRDIAEVVQNDQALAAKILKTVNSSFYGLTTPCPTIKRAMSYLGLNTVKSLVLGFSFVDAFGAHQDEESEQESGFSLTDHWRRAIYSAASARIIAKHTSGLDPDEAFIAALMQDVGMLTMFVAIPEYTELLDNAHHDEVLRIEQEAFGFTHLEVGLELAVKWRLPISIQHTVTHHHDPADAPELAAPFVRCGALASHVATVAATQSKESDIQVFFQRARAWFRMDREQAESVLSQSFDGAAELSSLFQVHTGRKPDLVSLLSQANDAMLEHQITTQRQSDDLQRLAYTDGLTGIANRKRFDDVLGESFEEARQKDGPLSVLFCDADKFKPLNDTHGHQAGDAVLVELASRLSGVVGDRGTVCRYGGEEFAVVLPGVSADEASIIAERCRRVVADRPFDVRGVPCEPDELSVTISVGLATREERSGDFVRTPELLLRAADKAVYSAKDSGRNCVRLIRLRPRAVSMGAPTVQRDVPSTGHAPSDSPSPTTPAVSVPSDPSPSAHRLVSACSGVFPVLVVEDDFLQSKLISMPLCSDPHYTVEVATDGATALERLANNEESAFRLILLDVGLPDIPGAEVVRSIRRLPGCETVPIVMLSAAEDDQTIRDCLLAGANAYITKQSICDDPKSRILKIAEFWTTTCQAA